MNRKITGDYMGWLTFGTGLILLFEIAFFNSGLIFSLFLAGAMIYIGRKKAPQKRGRFLFWTGIVILIASLMNMYTFKLVLIALLIFALLQFAQTKKSPKLIAPVITGLEGELPPRPLVSTKPLFHNIFFGEQKTPSHVYEWNDINIQGGVGDTTIDLSYTLLPKGETVIFIRNFVGNIQLLVPYDLEVSISHSVVAGSTSVFGQEEPKVFNQVYQFRTPDYEQAGQKVKIVTSLIVGNLEVSRI